MARSGSLSALSVRAFSALVFASISTADRSAEAAPITAPLEVTRDVLERARGIVAGDRTHDEKLAALGELLRKFLDTDTMGRTALGEHWSRFDAGQRKEFLALFRDLFQRTYVQRLLLFERPDFAYVGEDVFDGGRKAVVHTKIVTPKDEFAVTYRLRRSGRRWMVVDIQVEDLSLTANFRRQLGRLLERSTVENILDRMRRKRVGAAGEDGGAP